jgi:mono/diheme cytochrome c family protein
MPKLAFSFVLASLMTMLTASTVEKGVRDVTQSMTVWTYFGVRDMRQTVVLDPQKTITRGPDSSSVPTAGREHVTDLKTLAATLANPVPSDEASIAEGEDVYKRTCTPCHGLTLKGDGPVVQFFIPPPDLLGPLTRGRSDGYMYSYIRNGGAVMPSYGFQLSAEQTWHVVNFIRHKQRSEPR